MNHGTDAGATYRCRGNFRSKVTANGSKKENVESVELEVERYFHLRHLPRLLVSAGAEN